MKEGLAAAVRAAFTLAAVLYLFAALPSLGFHTKALEYPYALDREEGFILAQVLRSEAGEAIYKPIAEEPWLVGNYPPVFYAVGKLFVSEDDPNLGRLRLPVSLSAVLLFAVVVGGVGWLTRRPELGLFAAAHFLATFDYQSWGAYARVDIPALALSVAAWGAFALLPRTAGAVVSALLCIAAFYTKQTQLAVPIGIVAALSYRREWKPAALFVGIAAGGALLALLLLQLATDGEFWRHTVTYNRNAMDWSQVFVWLRHLGRMEFAFLCAALVAAVHAVRDRRALRNEESPLAAARVAALGMTAMGCLSLLTTAKAGAAENYLLDFHLAVGLLVALEAGVALRLAEPEDSSNVPLAWPAVMALCVAAHFFTGMVLRRDELLGRDARMLPYFATEMSDLVKRRLPAGGTVLSEEGCVQLLSGTPPFYHPFIMSQLAREGRWDDSDLVAAIRDKRYDAIVTLDPLQGDGGTAGFTETAANAIRRNYRREGPPVATARDVYWLWVPR